MSASDVLSLRLGTRFLIVTLFPNFAFVVFLGAVVVAGAPGDRPDWHRIDDRLQDMSLVSVVLLTVAVLVASVALHPLNYAIVQLMEGYWQGLPFGAELERVASERGGRYRQALRDRFQEGGTVGSLLYWLPAVGNPVRPTTLGNVLFAGEVRAGARYGYVTEFVLPRLVPLLSDQMRAHLGDARNQLDAAARLCSLSLVSVPVTTLLLIRYDVWLLVPVACYLFAWASYRSSVSAARRFGNELAVAFDLHHLALWDALSLERPADLENEYEVRGPLLTKMFYDEEQLQTNERETFSYLPPPPPPWPPPPWPPLP
ncbi:hypothetical protein [Paractinoplanes maris]|uniref:hypothetical protein n=1 Tax=Paractinoplanes maris TaxID=1734446 RepID=UPI0020226A90|nr:hypothetical protein [Actinoplanes maris]